MLIYININPIERTFCGLLYTQERTCIPVKKSKIKPISKYNSYYANVNR